MTSTTKNEDYIPEWVKVLRQAILESEKEEREKGGGSNRMDRLEQVQ